MCDLMGLCRAWCVWMAVLAGRGGAAGMGGRWSRLVAGFLHCWRGSVRTTGRERE